MIITSECLNEIIKLSDDMIIASDRHRVEYAIKIQELATEVQYIINELQEELNEARDRLEE